MKRLGSYAGAVLIVLGYAALVLLILAVIALILWGISVGAERVGITRDGVNIFVAIFMGSVLTAALLVQVSLLASGIRDDGFKHTVGSVFGIEKWKNK